MAEGRDVNNKQEKPGKEDKENKEEKNSKREKNEFTNRGFVRKKFVVPSLVLFVTLVGSGFFLLDQVVKMSFEKGLEAAVGAEVNVADVAISLSEGSLNIAKTEVTNPDQPTHNLVSFDSVVFKISSYELFKLRLIVEKANLSNFQLGSKRLKEGRVFLAAGSEDIETDESGGPDNKSKEQEGEGKGPDVFAKISKLFSGFDLSKKLKEFDVNEFPTIKRAVEAQKDVESATKEITGLAKTLPSDSEFSERIKKIESVGKSKDPKQLKNDLDLIRNFAKESARIAGQVGAATSQFSSKLQSVRKKVEHLDDNLAADYDLALSKLELPNLDFEDMAETLLGPNVKKWIEEAKKYYALAAPYMKSDGKQNASNDSFRLEGRTIEFPSQTLPRFWVKTASLTGGAISEGQVSTFSGKMENLSSSLAIIGKPFLSQFEGDLPSHGAKGIFFKSATKEEGGEYDHEFEGKIAVFPVTDFLLFKNEGTALNVKEANASFQMSGSIGLKGKAVKSRVDLTDSRFKFFSDDQNLSTTLDSAFSKVSDVYLSVTGKGAKDEDIGWKTSSNVSSQISGALKEKFSAKINEVKSKVNRLVRDELAGHKRRLNAEIRALQDRYGKVFSSSRQAAEDLRRKSGQAKAKVDKAVADQKRAAADSVKSKIRGKVNNKDLEKKGREALKGKLPGF